MPAKYGHYVMGGGLASNDDETHDSQESDIGSAVTLKQRLDVTVRALERTVMDLSFPDGTSVNDGIPKATYLGDPFKLHYPTTVYLIKLINDKGPMCLLYKVDIERSYRWLPVDPFDFHLLGMSWRDIIYFDTKMPFGVHTGAMAAQCKTKAIMCMAWTTQLCV